MWLTKLKRFGSAALPALLLMLSLSFLACDNEPIFGSRIHEPPDDKIEGDPGGNDPSDDG